MTYIHDGQKLTSKPSQDPSIYVSAVESEQVVKLLQSVAGDIETNPGPILVSAFIKHLAIHCVFSDARFLEETIFCPLQQQSA